MEVVASAPADNYTQKNRNVDFAFVSNYGYLPIL